MTLSVIAFTDGLVGAAVTSCVLGAGRRILHVAPTAGACVTQAAADIVWGGEILAAMAVGSAPLTALEPYWRDNVQLAAVDFGGNVSVFTGGDCDQFAAHATQGPISAQVNTAALPDAPTRMVDAYQGAVGQPLAERLVAALAASGGDARGHQAAAVIVTSRLPLNGDADEPHVDLRVDDHGQPVEELARLLSLHRAHCDVRRASREDAPEIARRWLTAHPGDPYLRACAKPS